MPCLSTVMPWQAWYFGRGAKPGQPSPFKWTYHFGFGVGEFFQTYISQWQLLANNRTVGVLYPNDADGNAVRSNLAPLLAKEGYRIVDPGPYEDGTSDFSAQIALFKREKQGGSIINVASIAGFGWRQSLDRAKAMVDVPGFPDDLEALAHEHGAGDVLPYVLSKELLLLWTFRAAHEPRFKAHGLRVNAVSPGPVETPILAQFRSVLGDARVDSDIGRVGRPGRAADVAPVIAFLCSDAARWINGANIPVDGGLEASVSGDVLGFGVAETNR